MNLTLYNDTVFESIKHIDEFGNEYWEARKLQIVLEYAQWRRFEETIKRAMKACENSKYKVSYHFAKVGKIVEAGATHKSIIDYKLSRYACYLIVQNGDPKKEVIALGQTYFAIQTRRQELSEKEYSLLSEDEKRFYMRSLTKKGNYSLNQTVADIAKRKELGYREDILDNMGSEELADNLFRIVQTDAKIKRDNIKGENNACITHNKMGKDIRTFIKNQWGTMPEDLPKPEKSLKKLAKEEMLKISNN